MSSVVENSEEACQVDQVDAVKSRPHVAIVVLCYNERQWLDRCLSSVLRTEYDDFTVVFVDNASSDGSTDFVRERFPDVEMVRNRQNLGYAGGNNSGIRHALERKADYVVLLNPDTWVEPDWLDELLSVFNDNPTIGVTTALIRNYDDDDLDHNCMQILRSIPQCMQDLWRGDLKPWYETDSGSGAALMVKREFFETVGIIDPEFFIYFEEIDLLRRGRYHGFRMAISTRGVVHHYNRLENPEGKRPTKIRFERGHMIYTLKNQFEPVLKSMVKFVLEGPSRISGALLNREWQRAFQLMKVTLELYVKSPLILWRRQHERHAPHRLPEMKWLRESDDDR